MSREDFLKEIHSKKDSNNKIDLLVLYPIINKAMEEMQLIIDSKVEEINKIKRHDRAMRDKAHKFSKLVLERDEIIKSNIKQIEELQYILRLRQN